MKHTLFTVCLLLAVMSLPAQGIYETSKARYGGTQGFAGIGMYAPSAMQSSVMMTTAPAAGGGNAFLHSGSGAPAHSFRALSSIDRIGGGTLAGTSPNRPRRDPVWINPGDDEDDDDENDPPVLPVGNGWLLLLLAGGYAFRRRRAH
ncbi:MAG: hypothetical protein IJV55_01900 [Paludibacteraceae bacterium]|nr:hypothetical protein [Paludibacteraceae bacterium]